MGLIDRMADRFGFERRSDDLSWAALAPQNGAIGALSARQSENLSAVLACVTAISTSLAYVPAKIYELRADGQRIAVPSHPVPRMVREGVASGMSWPEFIEHMLASALLNGNALAEIVRSGNGRLTGFNWIPWQHVSVVELSSGRLAYDVSNGRGRSRRLLEGEAIHLRDRTDDGIVGRSRLSRAADSYQGVQAANDFQRNFLKNGAQPSGVIEAPASMGPEAIKRFTEQFERNFSGVDRAGRTLLLDGGMQWKAASITPEDAELLESRKFGVIEICRIFQVPPPIVQAYENNTFTNAAQAGLWFATFCLSPWARRIEAEFSRSVFPAGSNLELELDLSGFLRGDPETRWRAHEIAINMGVLDADEVRQLEGWNRRAEASA